MKIKNAIRDEVALLMYPSRLGFTPVSSSRGPRCWGRLTQMHKVTGGVPGGYPCSLTELEGAQYANEAIGELLLPLLLNITL